MREGYERVSFPPQPESRRSFSEIVPPPWLSSRHHDPLSSAPRRFSEDSSRRSEDSADTSDASEDEFDEKMHFVDSNDEESGWDKAAALRHDRVIHSVSRCLVLR